MSNISVSSFKYYITKYWLLLLPGILLIPALNSFPFSSPDALFTDLAVAHYPSGYYLQQAILEYKTIPLWSPFHLSGFPFAAHPLSHLYYPFGWLALIFPLPFGFNLVLYLHFVFGGFGLTLFLKNQGLSNYASLFGGIAFQMLPRHFAFFGSGHLTTLYALMWIPWLLISAQSYIQGTTKNKIFLPGVIIGLIFLAYPQGALYSGLLWLAWTLAKRLKKNLKLIYHILKQIGLAALISAPLALPMLKFTKLSTRANLTESDIFVHSLPPGNILGLLFPAYGGAPETLAYFGTGLFGLTVIGLLLRQKETKFWLGVAAVSLLFSLGENLPFLNYFVKLPGFSLTRVPSRALFLTGISLIVIGTYTLDAITNRVNQKQLKSIRLTFAGIISFAFFIALGFWRVTGEIQMKFFAGGVFILVFFLITNRYFHGRLSTRGWQIGVITLVIVDLVLINFSLFAPRAVSQVLSEQSQVAQYLAERPGKFRIYSPSYSIPQQVGALYGLEMANGVDPLILIAYEDYMAEATNVPSLKYSVTLPAFDLEGEIGTMNQPYTPDAERLGTLNVKYVAADFDIAAQQLILLEQFGSTRIYENTAAMPRAWVETTNGKLTDVTELNWTPNQIKIKAVGPGTIFLSEVAYPGWIVSIDGKKSAWYTSGIIRAVDISAGPHTVLFSFRPTEMYI
ncbi:MAG: 6-pyruvoyl-tetrahydropterin synthase-related protein, partial [Chloroflexota bacterium]